ncbi:Arrestin domain-containing protein 1, partial [Armadillidium nasatum]
MNKCVSIIFENREKWFLPGESIDGKVVVSIKKDIKCRGLKLTFEGFSYVNLKGAKKKPESNNEDSKKEVYYNVTLPLLGQQGTKTLKVGDHSFAFHYRLPQNIPSSFESKYGYVRHYAEAVIEFQGLLNPTSKCTEILSVNSALDLSNYYDFATTPRSVLLQKDIKGALGRRGGNLEVSLNVNKTAFVPGEHLIINAVITNTSSKILSLAKALIVQEAVYTVGSHNLSIQKIIGSNVKKYIQAKSDYNWKDEKLLVPEVPSSQLKGCSLIDLSFYFHFEVQMKSPARVADLETDIPIIIGTIPLGSAECGSNNNQTKEPYNISSSIRLDAPSAPLLYDFSGIEQMGPNQAIAAAAPSYNVPNLYPNIGEP